MSKKTPARDVRNPSIADLPFPFTIANLLPKLSTLEDDGQQDEMRSLIRADVEAGALVLGGVLLSEDATAARLDEALDRLDEPVPSGLDDELGRQFMHRQKWSYRLGLAVGLRLAQALAVPAAGGAR
jgi:hypothetical protein